MKKILLSALGLASVLGIASCSEDFKIAAPYKNVTIVNGLIDMGDTAHYIRIQKAFMDENKSAIDMAKVSDSSFFPESSLQVTVKEFNGNNSLMSTTTLQRVDLGQEGYTKSDGTFFTTPNYGYKFKKALSASNTYRLIVKNLTTGEVDSAQTGIINNDPQSFYAYELRTSGFAIEFTTTKPGQKATFSLLVRVPGGSASTQLLDGVIRFHWVDKNTSTGAETENSYDWQFASNTGPFATTTTLSVAGSSFFSVLEGAMGPAPAGIERYMSNCDVFLWAGDATIYNYQQYTLSAFGLTADQIKPIYSNVSSSVSGTYPVGIFASRAVNTSTGVPIGTASLDSLMVNPTTANLNIKGISGH